MAGSANRLLEIRTEELRGRIRGLRHLESTSAAMDDGRVFEMKAGDIFYIEPGHDSWVIGQEPYVSLHLMGASEYARHKTTTAK